MLMKTLNVNGKILLGVFSVVLVVTAVTMIQVVFSAPGGNGKVKGNSCMSRCLKIDAIEFDSSSEEVQYCKSQCIGTEEKQGNCLCSADGCCVPNTEICPSDPDCLITCTDNDGDGYGNPGDPSCPSGSEIDCDDSSPDINPGATETCNGIDDDCDGFTDEDLTRSCGSGGCTGIETCTAGVWGDCSSDGNSCDDSLFCNIGETCQSGVCTGGSPYDCTAWDDSCNLGVCNEDIDECEAQPKPDGTACDDGLFCTDPDTCTAGVCGGSDRDCSDGVGCTDDSCDEVNDVCVNTPNDGNCPGAGTCDDATGYVWTGVCDAVSDCTRELAPSEVCDGLDNDCDDSVDEDPACDGCVKVATNPATQGMLIYVREFSCSDVWTMSTNEVGVAVDCDQHISPGAYYAEAFSGGTCQGENSFIVDDSYTGSTVVPLGTYCSC